MIAVPAGRGPRFRCGSYRPGWLSNKQSPTAFNYESATLPTQSQGIVNRSICYFGDYLNNKLGKPQA